MSKKILIVDDHPDLRRLVSITLCGTGFELIEACDGDQALELILQHQPSLVVLDVMMPGKMDGFQLCEYIKSAQQLQFIKVLLLSARSQATDLEKGLKVRADDYMVKPFSPLLLLRKVNELME